MKKAICIMALMALIFTSIFCVSNPILAATEATFTVTCEAPKSSTGVGQTKEVTFYYGVKNFVNFDQFQNKGINVFRAILEFDENIFEPIEINLDSNGNFTGIKTKTKKGEHALVGETGWSGLTYNPENHKLIVTNGAYINTEQLVLRVTLKVKPNATIGKTTVTLKDIEAANTEKDIYPTNRNISTEVEIVDSISEAVDPDHENGFGGYLRILPDITVEELKLIQPVLTTLKDSSGKTLSNSDYVPTGATTADSNFSYTIITVGDLNSDGKMTSIDLSQLKAYIVKSLTTLNDNQKRAADIKWDGKLYSSDLSQGRQLIVSLGDPKVSVWYGTGDATCVPVDSNNN